MKRRRKSNDFWVGRLAVEVAVAANALEMGDVELAHAGLREVLDDLLPEADDEIRLYVNEIRQERQALTPVDIPYRGASKLTGKEIANRI